MLACKQMSLPTLFTVPLSRWQAIEPQAFKMKDPIAGVAKHVIHITTVSGRPTQATGLICQALLFWTPSSGHELGGAYYQLALPG